jgi:hypothetical protein
MKVICSIYDSKSMLFSTPFTSRNTQTAQRDFHRAVNDSNLECNQFPADYQLFEIAQWDEENGLIQPYTLPLFVARADQLIQLIKPAKDKE